MARKPTIKGAINSSVKSQMGWCKYYRNTAKKLREIGNQLPIELPANNLTIEEYLLIYSPKDSQEAIDIRAKVGRILSIAKWEREVNQYNGSVSYRAKYILPNGHELTVVIRNGELAPGCKVIQVEELRKVWKSVCPDAEDNTQLELTS